MQIALFQIGLEGIVSSSEAQVILKEELSE